MPRTLMNEWIIAAVLAGLIYIQIKILKGLAKIICAIIIFIGLLVFANYFIMPRLGQAPVQVGLEKFLRK